MPIPKGNRKTGDWTNLTGEKNPWTEQSKMKGNNSLTTKSSTTVPNAAPSDICYGKFTFGSVEVDLVERNSIPGIIRILVYMTLSDMEQLCKLNHDNIISSDDSKWIPKNENEREHCVLYITKPPMNVTTAAAISQAQWSIKDACRMCKDILSALEFLAENNLSRGGFNSLDVMITEEGFKLPNIHLCKVIDEGSIAQDLLSIENILNEVESIEKGKKEWFTIDNILNKDGSIKIAKEGWLRPQKVIASTEPRKVFSKLLSDLYEYTRNDYDKISSNERLYGIVYLVNQQSTFPLAK